MKWFDPRCVLVCLVVAGPAFPADPGPPSRASARAGAASGSDTGRLARRCQPRASKRWSQQGTMLHGMSHGWTEQAAMSGQGNVLASVSLGGPATGLKVEGGHLGGQRVVGLVLQGTDGDGNPAEVAICGAEPSPEDPGMTWYRIQAWNPVARDWQNPCAGAGDERGPRALAVRGVWDETGAHRDEARRFTFACETGAIAKCALWGYKPWAARDGRSLADAHQACTRMVRADYCGNGKSHTSEGVAIDYYDPFGINALTTQVSRAWNPAQAAFEAAWGPDGASCMARTRDGRALEAILQECPGRFQPVTADPGDGDRCAVQRSDANARPAVLRNHSRPGRTALPVR